MAQQAQEQLVIGRGGVRIPEIIVGPDYDAAYSVGRFFHRLWEANGFEEDDRQGLPPLTEMVIPPEAEKSLVVIRRTYTPTSDRHRQLEMRGNARRNAWDNSGGFGLIDEDVVTVGEEEHQFLAPPRGRSLQWNSLFSYSYSHKGGARFIDSRQLDSPYIDFPRERQLKQRSYSKPYEEQQAFYNKGVAQALKKVVEIIT